MGFPRPRGDRPFCRVIPDQAGASGSPAHAGIDPRIAVHERGVYGSPAHAGIDPTRRCKMDTYEAVPPPTRG